MFRINRQLGQLQRLRCHVALERHLHLERYVTAHQNVESTHTTKNFFNAIHLLIC